VTAIGVAQELDGVLEYLEDPTEGIAGMAEVSAHASMPLATNMCVGSARRSASASPCTPTLTSASAWPR
jgi:L-alanine-DL-glutamate epimerase-like enolase superfamily enzyme